MTATNFVGLSMPVFTAFGWAGEETALNYAFSQLELFIQNVHLALPRHVQADLPSHGISRESQGVYLSVSDEVEKDVHIAFYARPVSLEIQLAITAKDVLAKGLAGAEKDLANAHNLITKPGPEWTLRVQQMLIEEESGQITHYQDLFKDSVAQFDLETAADIFSKAAYLNSQDKWVTPIYLSRRVGAEQAAAMGTAIVKVMAEQVEGLMPIFYFFSGRSRRKPARAGKRPARVKNVVTEPSAEEAAAGEIAPEDTFTYVAELKPLHLRRGFINLTPAHWPFFALNARTETRPVSVYYEGIYDRRSAVWRLQPNDLARVVLGPAAHVWLEENFVPNDRIQVRALKLDGDEIQIALSPAEA